MDTPVVCLLEPACQQQLLSLPFIKEYHTNLPAKRKHPCCKHMEFQYKCWGVDTCTAKNKSSPLADTLDVLVYVINDTALQRPAPFGVADCK